MGRSSHWRVLGLISLSRRYESLTMTQTELRALPDILFHRGKGPDAMDPEEFLVGERFPPSERPKLRVGILLWPSFSLLAFSGFVDALRMASDIGDQSRQVICNWEVLAESTAPVTASCGIRVSPTARFQDATSFDYLVVVAGLTSRLGDSPGGAEKYLKDAARAGVPLIGICTGTFVLAALGLLDGRRVCVGNYHYREFAETFPHLTLVYDQLFVADRDRITCTGGAASIDMAAFVVERHCGRHRSLKILHMLAVDRIRQPNAPQRVIHFADEKIADPRVAKAIGLMEQHITQPISITDLSGRLNISERQLERAFQKTVGTSPAHYFRSIRLHYGRWLLTNSRASITQIAIDCGFSDNAHFTRHFQREFGEGPHRFRTTSVRVVAP